ncbi:MAG: hypothetical protein HC825_05060 [Oscillatoriales cyanobacterium RM1_1_9]|nr:hypothetical protein [Oscillatoriales cyanobacterium RM1_1_9]
MFGAGQDRVIGVLGAKATNTTTATSSLDAIKSAGLSYEEAGIDAIAIAPYFGLPLAEQQNIAAIEGWTKKGTQFALDQLFKEITQGGVLPKGDKGGSIHKAGELISDYVDLAEKEGLDLVAYEGGQHIAPRHNGMENNKAIVDLFVAANRDPRMGAVYNQYFEQWDDLTGDGLFAHFSDVSPYGKWGSWGARESLYQKSSPKYDVIQDWLTNSQGSSPPTSTPNPTPNPTPTPTPEPPKNSEVFAGKPIIGVNQNKPNPGAGEKDTLIGNSNANLFVLGNSETAFYDDNASNLGKSWAGRATLKNFTLGEDRIQLHGSAEDYSLKTINGSTRIFETSGPVNEVIGLVPGGVTLDLNNSSQFIFV